jgi:hypothetical protein
VSTTFSEDLRRHLGMLFAKSESVHDFRHWFSKAWWEAESSAPEDLYDFASDIEHYTYILDSGVWDERSFIHELQEAAETYYSRRSAA